MNELNHTLRRIRPSLKLIAPQSYWLSILFGSFNVLIGLSLLFAVFQYKFGIIGSIPTQVWGLVFLMHGLLMLIFVLINDWHKTRILHLFGVGLKSAWWLQLLSMAVYVGNPDLPLFKVLLAFLYIWGFLIFLQFTIYLFFTPRLSDAQ